MAKYKTVAGTIGLSAQGEEDYKDTVKQYAQIIDEEALGGWSLHLIQQIAVRKRVYHPVWVGAIVGAFVVGVLAATASREASTGVLGFFLGLLMGAVLGCLGIKYKEVFFNMLVFVKEN